MSIFIHRLFYWIFAVVMMPFHVILYPIMYLFDCVLATEEELERRGNIAHKHLADGYDNVVTTTKILFNIG